MITFIIKQQLKIKQIIILNEFKLLSTRIILIVYLLVITISVFLKKNLN